MYATRRELGVVCVVVLARFLWRLSTPPENQERGLGRLGIGRALRGCVRRATLPLYPRPRARRSSRAWVVWMGDGETETGAMTAPCRACRIAREGNPRVRAGDVVAGRYVGAGVARVLGAKPSLLVVGWCRGTPGLRGERERKKPRRARTPARAAFGCPSPEPIYLCDDSDFLGFFACHQVDAHTLIDGCATCAP